MKKGCQRNQQLRAQGKDPALMTPEQLEAVPVPQGEGLATAPTGAAAMRKSAAGRIPG